MGHVKGASFSFDGVETLIPTVHPKTGKQMSDDEAVKAFKSGVTKKIGTFKSPKKATAFAKRLSAGFNERAINPSATGRKRIRGKVRLSGNPTN